jgi:hypothetical protein
MVLSLLAPFAAGVAPVRPDAGTRRSANATATAKVGRLGRRTDAVLTNQIATGRLLNPPNRSSG